MVETTSKINKSDAVVVEREGHRVLVGASSDMLPNGWEWKEDDNHKIKDDGDCWSITMGPLPILAAYDTWDDVPDNEKWYWKDGPQVEIFAGPPMMNN
jgi:hypothetical protein